MVGPSSSRSNTSDILGMLDPEGKTVQFFKISGTTCPLTVSYTGRPVPESEYLYGMLQ